jgi:hypothetical protein
MHQASACVIRRSVSVTPSFLVELKGDCYISAYNLSARTLLSYVLGKDKCKHHNFQLYAKSHLLMKLPP